MKVGIDIVDIARFNRVKSKLNVLGTIYTKKELKDLKSQDYDIKNLAHYFSIKEAFVKALGTGFSKYVTPLDIEIDCQGTNIHLNLSKQVSKILDKNFKNIYITSTFLSDNVIVLCILN